MDPATLTPDELLSTTRSVRKRLDLTRPVPRELIDECLTLALQAPSGAPRPLVAAPDAAWPSWTGRAGWST